MKRLLSHGGGSFLRTDTHGGGFFYLLALMLLLAMPPTAAATSGSSDHANDLGSAEVRLAPADSAGAELMTVKMIVGTGTDPSTMAPFALTNAAAMDSVLRSTPPPVRESLVTTDLNMARRFDNTLTRRRLHNLLPAPASLSASLRETSSASPLDAMSFEHNTLARPAP